MAHYVEQAAAAGSGGDMMGGGFMWRDEEYLLQALHASTHSAVPAHLSEAMEDANRYVCLQGEVERACYSLSDKLAADDEEAQGAVAEASAVRDEKWAAQVAAARRLLTAYAQGSVATAVQSLQAQVCVEELSRLRLAIGDQSEGADAANMPGWFILL